MTGSGPKGLGRFKCQAEGDRLPHPSAELSSGQAEAQSACYVHLLPSTWSRLHPVEERSFLPGLEHSRRPNLHLVPS